VTVEKVHIPLVSDLELCFVAVPLGRPVWDQVCESQGELQPELGGLHHATDQAHSIAFPQHGVLSYLGDGYPGKTLSHTGVSQRLLEGRFHLGDQGEHILAGLSHGGSASGCGNGAHFLSLTTSLKYPPSVVYSFLLRLFSAHRRSTSTRDCFT